MKKVIGESGKERDRKRETREFVIESKRESERENRREREREREGERERRSVLVGANVIKALQRSSINENLSFLKNSHLFCPLREQNQR